MASVVSGTNYPEPSAPPLASLYPTAAIAPELAVLRAEQQAKVAHVAYPRLEEMQLHVNEPVALPTIEPSSSLASPIAAETAKKTSWFHDLWYGKPKELSPAANEMFAPLQWMSSAPDADPRGWLSAIWTVLMNPTHCPTGKISEKTDLCDKLLKEIKTSKQMKISPELEQNFLIACRQVVYGIVLHSCYYSGLSRQFFTEDFSLEERERFSRWMGRKESPIEVQEILQNALRDSEGNVHCEVIIHHMDNTVRYYRDLQQQCAAPEVLNGVRNSWEFYARALEPFEFKGAPGYLEREPKLAYELHQEHEQYLASLPPEPIQAPAPVQTAPAPEVAEAKYQEWLRTNKSGSYIDIDPYFKHIKTDLACGRSWYGRLEHGTQYRLYSELLRRGCQDSPWIGKTQEDHEKIMVVSPHTPQQYWEHLRNAAVRLARENYHDQEVMRGVQNIVDWYDYDVTGVRSFYEQREKFDRLIQEIPERFFTDASNFRNDYLERDVNLLGFIYEQARDVDHVNQDELHADYDWAKNHLHDNQLRLMQGILRWHDEWVTKDRRMLTRVDIHSADYYRRLFATSSNKINFGKYNQFQIFQPRMTGGLKA